MQKMICHLAYMSEI